jgi:outer membrane protein assembly factor BamD (BamD/ComL family)
MGRRRFRRKDLKRPDEFISHGWQFLTWAGENSQSLSWGLVAVGVVALLMAGASSIRAARVRQANEDLGRALVEFRAGHYASAATQLAEVANRWQATAAGQLAALYAANADLKSDNLEAATGLLQDLVARRDWPPYLQQEALFDLGVALERKADSANAATRYQEAAAIDGPYAGPAVLGEARCRELLGEKDKAQALYQRYAHDFPDAAEADVVGAKLSPAPAAS